MQVFESNERVGRYLREHFLSWSWILCSSVTAGFDVAKAQCEPMPEPDGMATDLRREAVTMIAWSRLHPDILANR